MLEDERNNEVLRTVALLQPKLFFNQKCFICSCMFVQVSYYVEISSIEEEEETEVSIGTWNNHPNMWRSKSINFLLLEYTDV